MGREGWTKEKGAGGSVKEGKDKGEKEWGEKRWGGKAGRGTMREKNSRGGEGGGL